MFKSIRIVAMALAGLLLATNATAAERLSGVVLVGGAPVAGSRVTLWSASAGAPKQLAQARTDAAGRFAPRIPSC
jgi:5-hydroxyisourate hydrolase-like protein (transthyretin family)